MSYIGNSPTYGDTTSNFKLLDDISTYTLTFDGSSSAVVSISNYTITQTSHRFITGQRVTYTNGGGGSIGGLTSGTAYYIIKNDQNTVKLALTQSDAINSIAINLTALGTGSTHTLNVAFDGVNTKFKATYDNGTKALFTAAAQLQISINGVIQQPQNTTTPVNGFGFDLDAVVIFSTAPLVSDVFWGNIIANNFAAYDISDNKVDNFTGTGSQTAFYLSQEVPNNESLLVTIDGVVQYPSDVTTSRAYSVYNTQLIFTSAPGNGTIIQARHIGFAGAVTSNVTGFYGRTGNAVLTTADTVSIGAATIGTGGIGTSLLVQGNARITGILTIGTGSITLDGTNNIISGIDQTNTNNTTVLGIATFTNGPVIIGTSSSTGTASQRLQVTGGAYVSGNLGIGATNPSSQLQITGQFQSTQANSTTTGGGQIYLNGATGNRIDFNNNGVAAPTFSTRSAGTKIVLYPLVGAAAVDCAIGIDNDTFWSSVDTSSSRFRWYAGTTNITTLFGTGELVLGTTTKTGTASQPLQVTGSAYISGGLGVGVTNNTTAGSISASGTITGTQLISNIASGTAPLSVTSTTVVPNLNASYLQGYQTATANTISSIVLRDGSGNFGAGTITATLSGNASSATAVVATDSRNTTTTPQTINESVVFDFKANTTEGLSDGGTYFGEMTFRQYGSSSDWSGGSSHQLGFTDNGNIWQRSGSNTTWGSWKKLLDSSNYSDYSTFSGNLTLTTTPFFRNTPTITSNYTVTTSYNELSIGPITINNGITVTVNSGATWTVV